MIIVHVVEPFAAGIAVFVKYLTEAMPGDLHIIIHGERKQVMCAVDVKKTFSSPNVRFVKWHSAQRTIDPFKDFLALAELYKILKRLKNKQLIDGVHLHSSKSGLLGRIACRMLRIKNVFYTPNGAPFLSGKTIFSKYFYRQVERFGNSLGGRVVCCSPSELNAYLGLIAGYFSELDQFEFIWAGDGDDKHLLTAKNITVTGWLSQKEIKKLLSGADMYLSTALYEGLSFGVLEALTLHKPVLLSHCVGNMDVVKNGINGDLFKTEAEATIKILQYYNNMDMLRVMGSFSKSICDTEFNVRYNFSNYRELYANIIDLTPGKKWAFA